MKPFGCRCCRWLLRLGLYLAAAPWVRADCTLTNLGVTPINDLGPGLYKGYPAGLYPGGADTRPAAHEAAGQSIATNSIQPLTAAGNLDVTNGKIVLLSIGMSNTTDEWASLGTDNFLHLASIDPARNPRVIVVDGAQGGQDAIQWTNAGAATWSTVMQRLTAASVSSNQVQAIWLKQALARPANYGLFPLHAQILQNDLAIILRIAKSKFPNLRLAYLSCRTRCYSNVSSDLNPEPFAFETGFADKWVIEDQLLGRNNLNYDSTKGAVVAPWLSWGPYLWTDGKAGRSDGLTSVCPDDLQSDFTHPSPDGGVPKVARQLLAFFKTDPTAAPWFLRRSSSPPTLAAAPAATNGVAPLRLHFSASASSSHGAVTNYAWTYEDGDFANTQTTTKSFLVPGVYHVHLTVEDTSGNAASTTLVVNVTAPAFQFTSAVKQGNNLRLSWATRGGESYVMQGATSLGGTGRELGPFLDIIPVIAAPAAAVSTTSYVDAGVVSNLAARYYRVRLGP